MAQEGGQNCNPGIDVKSLPVCIYEAVDSSRVSKIVQSWLSCTALRSEFAGINEMTECFVCAVAVQTVPVSPDKQGSALPVAQVTMQFLGRGGVNGH